MWKLNWFLENIGKIRMASFICSQCGRWYRYERSLKGYVNQPFFSCDQCGRPFNRTDNLQRHMCNCTVAVPAAKIRCTGVALERLQFKLPKSREALKGSIQHEGSE